MRYEKLSHGLSRSSYYCEPLGKENGSNLYLMRLLDKMYLERPFYGIEVDDAVMDIKSVDEVWCADITYIPMNRG